MLDPVASIVVGRFLKWCLMTDTIHIPDGEKWLCSSEEWDYDAATRTLTARKPKNQRKYPDPERISSVGMYKRRLAKQKD